jgi:DNA-binding NtrC family response regulator
MANNVKVLVVDDEMSVRESFKMILEIKDYEVKTAKDMEEAEAAVKQENFDMAFVDLRFENRDIGLDILAKIKQIKPATEVAIVTAFPSEMTKINATQLGALGYINKPFTMESIYEMVDRALEKHKKTK